MTLFRDPDDTSYQMLLAENRFVSDIQLAIEHALASKRLSQADLARALEVSEARVSQILADNGKNLQARTIARIAHVIGMRACLNFRDKFAKIDVENADVNDATAAYVAPLVGFRSRKAAQICAHFANLSNGEIDKLKVINQVKKA